jgi:hypothetical protein
MSTAIQDTTFEKAVEVLREAARLYNKKRIYAAKQAIKDVLELLDELAEEPTS